MENPCNTDIQRTLAYSSVFKYPLSFYQLSTYLVTKKNYTYEEFSHVLNTLVSKGFIKKKNDKYFLPGSKTINWEQRMEYSKQVLKKNEKIISNLSKIPWIKFIGVTGSLANYSADKDTDIDLFVITAKNRVWLTRGFVFLILKALNKLPSNNKSKREYCPNIFIDEKNLSWKKDKRNLYIASNIITMQPIFDKEYTYFRFMEVNKWVKKYYFNFSINIPNKFSKQNTPRSSILNFLENTAYKWQFNYMKKRITTEFLTAGIIHFNKNSNSNRILESYNGILTNRKIS